MTEHMPSDKIFIGIDVSKLHLDIYIYPTGIVSKIENNAVAITHWIQKNAQHAATLVFEATGGYERKLLNSIVFQPHLTPLRVHPSRIKSFARAMGKRAKTDAIDAKMLALAAVQLGDSLQNTTAPAPVQELRDALMRRAQLQDILHAEQCRVKMDELSPFVVEDTKKHIEHLKESIEKIDKFALSLVDAQPELAARATRLLTVTGVGKQVMLAVLAFLPELGRVTRKQIAALAGFAPITQQSGRSAGRAFTHGGRQPLKKALYMAALVGIRYNPTLKAFYDALLARKKPKLVAIIACARKLITHLNAIEKNAKLAQ